MKIDLKNHIKNKINIPIICLHLFNLMYYICIYTHTYIHYICYLYLSQSYDKDTLQGNNNIRWRLVQDMEKAMATHSGTLAWKIGP